MFYVHSNTCFGSSYNSDILVRVYRIVDDEIKSQDSHQRIYIARNSEGLLQFHKGKNNMVVENIFRLDVTLQKLSAITIALHFWELPSAKDNIRKFREKHYPDDQIREKWAFYQIRCIEESFDCLKIPELLLDDVKCNFYTMGGLILDFIQHTSKNGFDIDFGLKICWAPYGRIDEVKMVRECLKGAGKKLPLEDRFFSLAKIYTEEDLASLYLVDMEEEMAFSEEEMFDFCLENKDLLFATRYYWKKLNNVQRVAKIRKIAQKILLDGGIIAYGKDMYVEGMKAELLVFFMAGISDMERLRFVTEYSYLLFKFFLDSWPYQEFCLKLLDELADYDTAQLTDLIGLVIERINSESFIKYKNKNINHAILQKLLLKTPLKVKVKYLKPYLGTKKGDFLYNLHENCDYKTLSIILNDDSTEKIKQKVINNFLWIFKNQIRMENFDFVNKYLRYVLDKEEGKSFKQKLNWVNEFACKEGDFHVADLLLNFLFDTETERIQEKKKVRAYEVFKFVAEGKFGVADEFVKWRFETDEERKKIKEAVFVLDDIEPEVHCADLIRSGNFEEVDNYFVWRFESEEERKMLMDSMLGKIDSVDVCSRLINDYGYKTARQYLDWRYESTEERDNVKKSVLELLKINPVEHCNDLTRENYSEAEEFLKMFFHTEEERLKIKKKVFALETEDPKKFVNYLIKDENPRLDPYLKWRFPTDEERRNFKKMLYGSDEKLRDKCYEILFKRFEDDFKSMNDECTATLEFFLESEEAVNEFRKFKLYEEGIFKEKFESFPRSYSENFLKYCSRSSIEN